MGKRSVGVGVWLAFGVLVLVAMAPKEIWIWLGVIGVSALIAYLAIGLLPVSRTPSLGVMMKPEVVHGDTTDIQR